MSSVRFGTSKNCPGQTPPAYQVSVHLIKHNQTYELFCVFLCQEANFWDESGAG